MRGDPRDLDTYADGFDDEPGGYAGTCERCGRLYAEDDPEAGTVGWGLYESASASPYYAGRCLCLDCCHATDHGDYGAPPDDPGLYSPDFPF